MSEIQELKNMLEKLQDRIMQLEQKENKKGISSKRKRVEYDTEYWYFNRFYTVNLKYEEGNEADNIHYEVGNYFLTKEEAVKEAEKRKRIAITHQKLKDLADWLNGDEVIDWENLEQNKYTVYYDYVNKVVSSYDVNFFWLGRSVFCLNKDFCKTAVKEIGEKELIYYLTDGEIHND